MIGGELVMIAGCVSLMQLEVDTSVVEWASFLVITGIGMGITQQLPYTAVQVALKYVVMPSIYVYIYHVLIFISAMMIFQ